MSEEEIMQGINKTISFMKEELKADHSCFTIQELWAVNGLLDLYNKEKEKNKKEYDRGYKEGFKYKVSENWEKSKARTITIKNKYISKDKIRELIKRIEFENTKEDIDEEIYFQNICAIEKLKQLIKKK